VSAYCREVRALGFRLYAAISASLGLEEEYVRRTLGEQEQHMAVNFYPRCPAPELTYGLPAHTDPNALTILLMDQQVAGLQVLNGGRWIAVNPRPNALVVNIGDQLQVHDTIAIGDPRPLSSGNLPCVWLERRGSGVEPTLVSGTAPTLLMFGCKSWVGAAPTVFFVWLEGRNMEWMTVLTPLMGPTCHRV
jgi:hypothetical protein